MDSFSAASAHPFLLLFLPIFGYQVWLLRFACRLVTSFLYLWIETEAWSFWTFISRKLSWSLFGATGTWCDTFWWIVSFCLEVWRRGPWGRSSLLSSQSVMVRSWRILKSSFFYLSIPEGCYGFSWCNKKLSGIPLAHWSFGHVITFAWIRGTLCKWLVYKLFWLYSEGPAY